MKSIGEAAIRYNGKQWKTIDNGATLDPGGSERPEQKGAGRVWGFTETTVAPTIEIKIKADADVDIIDLRDIVDATIEFDGRNGQRWMLVNAWTASPPKLDGGVISLTMKAYDCVRV
ncbi:phage tail tube protein [Shewanella algae]|uniref:phage tail tube protein n=1 Tax=Shewanella algae TaxID=38313 RepID=UPI0031F4AE19